MTAQENPPAPETPPAPPAQAPAEPPKETDWQAEARKWEARAKENKTAAERLAAIEEASKTELQKATERAEQAERRAVESEQTVLKTRIASEMGVIPEVIVGADETAMRASAQRVLDWAAQGKKPTPKPASLASGSAPPKSGEQGRAAAALRSLRQG